MVLDAAEPTLVPVEVTVQTALTRGDLCRLREGGPVAQLIAHQAEAFAAEHRYADRYAAACPGMPADLVNFQHDPLACAVALGWGGVTVERLPLPTVTTVDAAAFSQLWLATVLKAA